MPELPEVETVRRGLAARCAGRCVRRAEFNRDDILVVPADAAAAPADWAKNFTEGRTIASLGRQGKYLLMQTSDGAGWAVHLGMSGSLVLHSSGAPVDEHTHVVLHLSDGEQLHYRAPRRFGRWIAARGDGVQRAIADRVGIDALDFALDGGELANRLGGSGATIKSRLLDQRLVAGLGNIYADEILFAAGIHPQCPASELDQSHWIILHRCMRRVLHRALANHGTTFSSYRDADGRPGGNREHLRVYGRAGASCARCGGEIERIEVAGRGTHCCPACQRNG